jgi:ABC-type multidrug transport system fused ATPase/permease subunit
MLGPNGIDLSAGEAQLLALTRIFLKNPGLIILDEASSRLDPATEQLLEQAMERLLADRTAIIIAHRLATIRWVDQVLILEAGRIKEIGPYHDLVARPDSWLNQLLHSEQPAPAVGEAVLV